MDILSWLLVGLAAGAVARLVLPGRDPLGVLGTMVLGLVGSLLGGFLGSLVAGGRGGFEPAGLLGSIIGAILALAVFRKAAGRRRWGFRRRRLI